MAYFNPFFLSSSQLGEPGNVEYTKVLLQKCEVWVPSILKLLDANLHILSNLHNSIISIISLIVHFDHIFCTVWPISTICEWFYRFYRMLISFLAFSDLKELILLHILIYLGKFWLLSGIILGYFYGKHNNLTFQNHECSCECWCIVFRV